MSQNSTGHTQPHTKVDRNLTVELLILAARQRSSQHFRLPFPKDVTISIKNHCRTQGKLSAHLSVSETATCGGVLRQSQGARTSTSEVVSQRTNHAASRVSAHRGFRRRLCATAKTKRAHVVALLSLRQGASEPEISTKSHRSAVAASSTV